MNKIFLALFIVFFVSSASALTPDQEDACNVCAESWTNVGSCFRCATGEMTDVLREKIDDLKTALRDIGTQIANAITTGVEDIFGLDTGEIRGGIGNIYDIIYGVFSVIGFIVLLLPLLLIIGFILAECCFVIMSFRDGVNLNAFQYYIGYHIDTVSTIYDVAHGLWGWIPYIGT